VKSALFKIVLFMSALAAAAWAAPPQFAPQRRVGLTTGDQWEPSVAADGSGRIYVLYPHYGVLPACKGCRVPAMLLIVSPDNGKTWQPPRVILESGSGQFDPQIAVDPADRHTLYASWLQGGKREVVLAKSTDSGTNWSYSVVARGNAELDKPALAVRGQTVLVGFNQDENIWAAFSQDGGHSFNTLQVKSEKGRGWSLLAGATVNPAGDPYLSWASYSQAGGARGPVNLYVAKSADAGKTWNPVLLDVSASSPDCTGFECGEAYLGAQIALASDAGGTLYAVWSSGSQKLGPQRIYFASSTDAGENWTPKVNLSSAGQGIEHAFPAIVAGSAGDVRVAWMDSRNSSAWNTYYKSSSNGGATWSEETRISSYVRGYRYVTKDGFKFPFGDYFGIAIDNHDDTHIVWGEGLNYQSPGSIWYSSGR
jgi:hypothetical protein